MKAVLQNFRTGELAISEVAPPALQSGGIIISSAASLVSAGTEKAVIELAKMNPLQKARARPDLVRKVLNRAGQEGILGTAQIVMNLVSAPVPLGYSCAGRVTRVGDQVAEFQPGDRVACAGLGYANHAEVNFVPRNLAVLIPVNVSFEDAAYVAVGAIAMQGVRQADLSVGENVVVFGLGLLGQITAQICSASGCRVFGIDLDLWKVQLAKKFGMPAGQALRDEDVVAAVRTFTRERGADKILITAATASNEPVELAAELARDRACIVAVGDVGLNVPRRAYYEKELDLRLSRSTGPGRYDKSYEEKGVDYPISYIRWTEQRNMEAFLDLVAQEKIQLTPLTTHRFSIDQAEQAYALFTGKEQTRYIGIVLEYDMGKEPSTMVNIRPESQAEQTASTNRQDMLRIGIIGAGQFAQGVLMPRLRSMRNLSIVGVATGSGLTARAVADKYQCRFCTSDYSEILAQPDINTVLIATRHNLHAPYVCEAVEANKHVFVEKPLAIDEEQLKEVVEVHRRQQSVEGVTRPIIMVGFNRRFSPLATQLRKEFSGTPLVMNYRINAGFIASDNWVHDPSLGGGRIVGEVCHFIDVMQFISEAAPVQVFAWPLTNDGPARATFDNVSIQLRFADGSLGTITYVANGDSSFPKERLEVFGGGGVGVIDNWRRLEIRRGGKRSIRRRVLGAAKGYTEELRAFVNGIRHGQAPIPFNSMVATTWATFSIQESLRIGRAVDVAAP